MAASTSSRFLNEVDEDDEDEPNNKLQSLLDESDVSIERGLKELFCIEIPFRRLF